MLHPLQRSSAQVQIGSDLGTNGKAGSCQGHGDKVIRANKCLINSLPRELLLYIFSFLKYDDLGISVAPVCTAWRDLTKDPYLWKHLEFSYQNSIAKKDGMQRLLKHSSLLVSLQLSHCSDCGDLLRQVASTCTKLRDLTLTCCKGITESIWESLMKSCPNIQCLNVKGCLLDSSKYSYAIARLHKLRHLELSFNEASLYDGAVTTIAKQCKQLEHLVIEEDIEFYDYEVVYLVIELSHCLKSLFINGSYLTDVAYQSLGACTELETLYVFDCKQMTDAGLSGISELKNLTLLVLVSCYQLTPKGLSSLFSAGGLSLLKYLDVTGCHLDDSVLSAISRNCPRLLYLKLSSIEQLSRIALIYLPSALPNLEHLYLEDSSPTDDWILKHIKTLMPTLRLVTASSST